MYCFYNPLELTEEQKITYIQLLIYLAQTDNVAASMERTFVRQTIMQMRINPKILQSINIPSSSSELFSVLLPIKGRAMAIDLIHRLWFAASIDNDFADSEIDLIKEIAHILDIDDGTILKIANFVVDEVDFFAQAQEIFETDNVKC